MGDADYISDNLTSRGVINRNNMLSAFDAQNDLVDKLIDDEIYNQELYDSGTSYRRYSGVEPTNIKTNFFEIINTTTDFQNDTVDKLANVDISSVSLSYNKAADMYRNQVAVNEYVEGKKNKFKTRNKHLLEDVKNKKRQKEIYTYYYKKYNAQKKILFNIILGAILTIVLTYLNKRYKFIFNDTFFVLALGIIAAAIVINITIQLIEILFRNNINYDEYDFTYEPGSATTGTDDLKRSQTENELEKCDAEIKAYKGN